MMPEGERYTSNEEDYYEWDCDNEAAGEADTQDLLDDGLGYVADEFPEEV